MVALAAQMWCQMYRHHSCTLKRKPLYKAERG
ncbi:Uncharacterised protein [Vibrio cholerae]|nr:Uncharacterised protein [Vibrio cholerae]CSI87681.1 Uncharacterised protein [Vibrio cholerae]